jgi:hypothetical protein
VSLFLRTIDWLQGYCVQAVPSNVYWLYLTLRIGVSSSGRELYRSSRGLLYSPSCTLCTVYWLYLVLRTGYTWYCVLAVPGKTYWLYLVLGT